MKPEPFDPFDDRWLNRQRRRRPEDVAAALRAWNGKIDAEMRSALHFLGTPDFVSSDQMSVAVMATGATMSEAVLRRNYRVSLQRLGYEVFKNPATKRGRWRVEHRKSVVVHKKIGVPALPKEKLFHRLGY